METVMNERVVRAFAGEFTPKFLATSSAGGTPNIVPVISIEALDERTLIFGELMIWKTKKNLEANPKVSAAVFTASMNCWTARGDFDRFERTGEIYDRINTKDLFRYNAYTGLRNVGVINVRDVARIRGMLSPARIGELALASIKATRVKFGHSGPMPPQVTEKFQRAKAAKFISYVDSDGYPAALPALSLFPAGHDAMEFGAAILEAGGPAPPEPPFTAAACVITFDPVAYQVKGTVTEYFRRLGAKMARFEIEEVYSASPPLPGKRIDRSPARKISV